MNIKTYTILYHENWIACSEVELLRKKSLLKKSQEETEQLQKEIEFRKLQIKQAKKKRMKKFSDKNFLKVSRIRMEVSK